ncbi:BQ5605_C009g05419 [Microbotryum silenes-dioicae]|uniref:BQ5605_C009g05419 protein n=1 Tax=Microbotryum silenes-dioicae TaxID=796604 RepID=A0A2X0PFA7_9BASI|nr:BQ5605_C009g05419 [Microbotryum silenes-dioicae]
MPVRFCTLFASLERQCLLPLHSRNFSNLLLPAMTTASTSTNDRAALSSTESPAATIDTTASTTYDGALSGICVETIKWTKDRKNPPMLCSVTTPTSQVSLDYGVGFKARMEAGLVFDGCLPRTQWQDARYSLIEEAVDPTTVSIIVGGAQSPSEMFDRHFESVAMRTCDSNGSIMRKYDSMSIMAHVSAALNVAMKWAELAATRLDEIDWKPILPLLKLVVVAPAVVVVTSVVLLSAVPRAATCTNYNSWHMPGFYGSCGPFWGRYLSGVASSASVLWFKGQIPHRSRFLTYAPYDSNRFLWPFLRSLPLRHYARSRRTGWALPRPPQPRADMLDSNLRFSLPGQIPTVHASLRPCTGRIPHRSRFLTSVCPVPTGSVVLSKVVTSQASRRVPPFSNLGVKSPTARAFSRIALHAFVLWFRGQTPHCSCFLTSAPAKRCSDGPSEHYQTAHPQAED